jgi:glycine/D-amino acid oxidase-like deaminating enzyme
MSIEAPAFFAGHLSAPVEIAIIGGGIAGCTIAFELASRGRRVLLLEQKDIAGEASGRNTGTLLHQTESEVVQMMRTSLEIYTELAAGTVSFHLEKRDQLLLASESVPLETVRKRAESMRTLGIAIEAISGVELQRLFPPFRPDLPGGYVATDAWTLDPLLATSAFAQAAREGGADLRTQVRVLQIVVRSGRVEGLLTDQGYIATDRIVVANGPWMSDLLRRVDKDAGYRQRGLATGRGWLVRTNQPQEVSPWIIEEMSWPPQEDLGRVVRFPTLAELAARSYDQPVVEAFVLAPMADGDALLGASLAPSLPNAVEGIDMPSRLAGRALALAPGLKNLSVANSWYGLRPMTADGLPIAGATAIEGLYLHGGHGSLGMQAAPATARWLAESLVESHSGSQMAWLSPERLNSVS